MKSGHHGAFVQRLSDGERQRRASALQAAKDTPNVPLSAPVEVIVEIADEEPIDQWVCDNMGMRRWRPVLDRVDVLRLPDGSAMLRISRDGFSLKLNPDQRRHMARLLGED